MPDQKPPRGDGGPAANTGRPGVPSRPSGEPPAEEKEQFRQPTFWYNQQDREASFKMEDERWATSEQIKDWIKLAILVIATIVWGAIIYLIEPGLR